MLELSTEADAAGANETSAAANTGVDSSADNGEATDGVSVSTNSRVGIDVYAEPVASDEPITRIGPSTTLTAVGRTAARDWVRVELEDGTEAWAFLSLLEADPQAIQTLPVVQ